jgi:hypothetical protein
MAYKIEIPETSKEFRGMLFDLLYPIPKDARGQAFWPAMVDVSGWCQSVEIEATMSPHCAVDTPTTAWHGAVRKEFQRLYALGYSGGDFQHILLECWLTVMGDILLSPFFVDD